MIGNEVFIAYDPYPTNFSAVAGFGNIFVKIAEGFRTII